MTCVKPNTMIATMNAHIEGLLSGDRGSAGIVVPIEICALPAIGKANLEAAALGHGFMAEDADSEQGGYGP